MELFDIKKIIYSICILFICFHSCEKEKEDKEEIKDYNKQEERIKKFPDLDLISNSFPVNGTASVSIYTDPEIDLNWPIEEVFFSSNSDNEELSLRLYINDFQLKSEVQKINGNIQKNDSSVIFITETMLPAETELFLSIQFRLEQVVIEDSIDNISVQQDTLIERKLTFFTGTLTNQIEVENIQYMYPIKNQLNFYLDEYDKYEGYITLKKGRKDLFIDDNYFVLWQSDKDSIVSEYYGYDDDSKTFKFRIPNSLDTATIYTFSVVQQTNKNVLISYRFRTSFYKTLKEKIDNADVILSINDSVFDNKQYRIASYLRMNENFDIVEIKGFKGMSKLVNVELNHENNEWFDVLDWLMYDAYPIDDKLVITWRDTEQLGIPPYKDVWIEQDKLLSLEGDNIKYILSQLTDYYNSPSIKSDCSYTASRDFRELLNKYSSHSLHNSNIHMQRIITNTFPDVGLYIGRFEEKDEFYKLTYILPGKGIPTSIYILSTNVF